MNQQPYETPVVTEEINNLTVGADLGGEGSQPMKPEDPEW